MRPWHDRYAIVSFANFGDWRIRTQLLFTGRMPTTEKPAGFP